jgi:hypothetical protein
MLLRDGLQRLSTIESAKVAKALQVCENPRQSTSRAIHIVNSVTTIKASVTLVLSEELDE